MRFFYVRKPSVFYMNLHVVELSLSGGAKWFVLRAHSPSTENWWCASLQFDLRKPMISFSWLVKEHHGVVVSPEHCWAY